MLCSLKLCFGGRGNARDIAQNNLKHGRTELQIDVLQLEAMFNKGLLPVFPQGFFIWTGDGKDQGFFQAFGIEGDAATLFIFIQIIAERDLQFILVLGIAAKGDGKR